jgi:hypothetical protein
LTIRDPGSLIDDESSRAEGSKGIGDDPLSL